MELLRLEGIAKSFGKARVLQDIDLAIEAFGALMASEVSLEDS